MAQRVLAEQLKIVILLTPRALPGSAFGAMILAFVLWNEVAHIPMLLSLFFLALTVFLRIKYLLDYKRNAAPDSQLRQVARNTVLGAAMHGCCWGAFSLAAFVPNSFTYQCLVTAPIFALTSGAVLVSAQYYPCFVAFVVPLSAPIALRCIVEGTPASVGLGTVIFVALAFYLYVALYTSRLTANSIETRFENVDLVRELEIQKKAADIARLQAEHSRAEAESANQSKSRFLAAASHDLRQPVYALSLFVSAMKQSTTEVEQESIHAHIEESVKSLAALFDSLLDVSRLDAGILQPEFETVALAPMLRKLAAEYSAEAHEKRLQFRIRCSELIVRTDPVLIERMIRNLLTNALRYTKIGGVLLVFRKRGACARVEVWDTGVGIAPDKQTHVFEEFYQIGNPERDRRKGVGLGLAIVKRIAALLQHPLNLTSRVEQGTRISIGVPLISVVDEAARRSVAREDDLDSVLFGIVIVAIDDDLEVLTAVELLLQQWGCMVIAAESAADAIMKLQVDELTPTLIMSDYRLRDEETGVAAVRALRAEFGDAIPALLVTGDTAIRLLPDVAASGLMVLHKPLDAGHLKDALIRTLGDVDNNCAVQN